jgi:diamine N-acetyltransferase
MKNVTLKEITEDSLRCILNLKVSPEQRKFVADNATSIAQAHFSKTAWFRAVYADGIPVGFVLIENDDGKDEFCLWRFMIDAIHQGKGYGKQALKLVNDHVKKQPNATKLILGCVQGNGSPERFYKSMGFEHTGEYEDGEAIMKLEFL